MAVKDLLKVSRKTFLNPAGWVGYDSLKGQNKTLWELVKGSFVIPQAEYQENFDQAKQRLKLNEENLKQAQHTYQLLAFIFAGLGIISFLTGVYLLFQHGSFTSLILGCAVTLLFLGQAFKYHFWFFQIKQRKLGCTFDEWRKHTLKV